jgi:D-3-phosphoglycerate dehydrogenase
VVFVNFAPITDEVLDELAPGATVIRYGVGYDNVDIEAARSRGVSVANVPDYGIETVADHAAAALLSLSRRLSLYNAAIRADGWVSPAGLGPVPSWRRMTVGFLGFGKIAQAVQRRLQPFGAKFIAYDPFCPPQVFADLAVESVSLEELASRSDALSLHAPLSDQTRKVVNAEFISRMPDGAILVNTARGGLIDEEALVAALAIGKFAGVQLDVTDPEPVPVDSRLREFGRVLFSPHAAFYDSESLERLQQLASEEAGRALRGEALRCAIV